MSDDDRWSTVELHDAMDRLASSRAERERDVVSARDSLMRMAAMGRAIAGRSDPPTPEEASAHCETGGFWQFREIRRGEPYAVPLISGDADVVLDAIRRARKTPSAYWWWRLDGYGRVVDW